MDPKAYLSVLQAQRQQKAHSPPQSHELNSLRHKDSWNEFDETIVYGQQSGNICNIALCPRIYGEEFQGRQTTRFNYREVVGFRLFDTQVQNLFRISEGQELHITRHAS